MENTQVGPFLILSKLGNRRHRVYRARQVEQDKEVALKFIKVPPTVTWHKALEKLDREVNQLVKLRHPNLVRVFGAGVEEDKVFFASELVEGESLASILRRRGKLAHDQVVNYALQISEFLVFLHEQQLIHSKLTPEKILVTPDGKIKITDLRLNRANRRRWDSSRRHDLDIAAYMAPEQFTEGASEKSDFYSLGVMVYEMLSGKLPYPPDTMGRMTKNKLNAPIPSIATHVMNCPIWLDKIVTQTLDPDPRNRPHSAKAIVMAFQEIQNIDATQKAAVDQMVSGFNPLTAGEDKSEAKKLLGQEDPKPEGLPFYQSIWFHAAALSGVALLTLFLLIQSGAGASLEKAKALVNSNKMDDWSEARTLLASLMDGDSETAQEATKLYYQSRQKTLVARVEASDINRTDNEHAQQFNRAYWLEQNGDDEDAADIYAQLVSDTSADGDYRHIYLEAKVRYDKLSDKFLWPDDPAELLSLIEEWSAAQTEPELMQAQSKLGQIAIQFAGLERYDDVLAKAEELRKKIKLRLIELRDSEAATTSPTNL